MVEAYRAWVVYIGSPVLPSGLQALARDLHARLPEYGKATLDGVREYACTAHGFGRIYEVEQFVEAARSLEGIVRVGIEGEPQLIPKVPVSFPQKKYPKPQEVAAIAAAL